MSHKGRRAYIKPISAYMEAEGAQPDLTTETQHDQTSTLVVTIKNAIAQEFGKFEVEFCNFKLEVCNSLDVIEWKVDDRLAAIV